MRVTAPRILPVPALALAFALGLGLPGCKPVTMTGEEEPAEDLAPRSVDLSSCKPVIGLPFVNPSFEESQGFANNTGAPASTIKGWDGCCNDQGQGLTTTWTVLRDEGRCGGQAVSITSTSARGDVLNQGLRPADAAGRSFTLTAWVKISSIGAGGSLLLDLFDLNGGAVVAASPTLSQVQEAWVPLSVVGQMPPGMPWVQIRFKSSGTLRALADDVSLTLR
jgi:hypothetical protein